MHLCLSVYVYVFSIKNDDKMIQAEGLESLSEYELRQACRERGHLGLLSTEEMRLEVCSVLLAHAMFFFPFDTRITTSDSKYYLSCIKENLLSWTLDPRFAQCLCSIALGLLVFYFCMILTEY